MVKVLDASGEERAVGMVRRPEASQERTRGGERRGLAYRLWGFGRSSERRRVSTTAGARTLVQLIPARQIGIVVLTNAFPTGFPEGIAASFFDIVFDGAPSRDWTAAWNAYYASLLGPANIAQYGTPPVNASPALPPATYAGTYANDYLGQVRVVADGADLMLYLGPGGKISHRLMHFDRDTFTMHASPESPDVPSPLVFSIGGDGKATTLAAARAGLAKCSLC